MFGKNWKTSLGGLAAILGGVSDALVGISSGDYSRLMADGMGIVTGFGLLFAKDHDVTGVT